MGGTDTLRASLQGFQAFVQTGIPVVVGNIVRINGKPEVGGLTETVTVVSEAALLKTDKADVSTDLRPEGDQELPLRGRESTETAILVARRRSCAGSRCTRLPVAKNRGFRQRATIVVI